MSRKEKFIENVQELRTETPPPSSTKDESDSELSLFNFSFAGGGGGGGGGGGAYNHLWNFLGVKKGLLIKKKLNIFSY